MATTFKAVVMEHHKKQDGKYNVKIRVTHNRQVRYIATNVFVTKDDLTRGLKIKSQDIIDILKKEVAKYQDITNTIDTDESKEMNVNDVLAYISNYRLEKKAFELDFIKFGEETIQTLNEAGNNGNAAMYKVVLNSLCKYLGRDSMDISEFTVQFLRDYCHWLQTKPARDNRPDKATGRRAPSLYLSTLRALHNKAKSIYNDEDRGIINIPYSPFKNFKLPPIPVSQKRALTEKQLKELTKLEYITKYVGRTQRRNFSKDIFMLSFALIGMNAADLYSCTDLTADGWLVYNREKTKNRRKDRAIMKVKIQPVIQPLIDKYRDKTGKRVFVFYKMYSSAATFSTALNLGLKDIGTKLGVDDLEFYATRHTWATLARNRAKIDKYIVHEALNHVDEKMKVTDMYIDKDWNIINDANLKLLTEIKFTVGNTKEEVYERKYNINRSRAKGKTEL